MCIYKKVEPKAVLVRFMMKRGTQAYRKQDFSTSQAAFECANVLETRFRVANEARLNQIKMSIHIIGEHPLNKPQNRKQVFQAQE